MKGTITKISNKFEESLTSVNILGQNLILNIWIT